MIADDLSVAPSKADGPASARCCAETDPLVYTERGAGFMAPPLTSQNGEISSIQAGAACGDERGVAPSAALCFCAFSSIYAERFGDLPRSHFTFIPAGTPQATADEEPPNQHIATHRHLFALEV